MSDRVERGKSRLENHESKFQKRRDSERRGGQVPPEDTVKIPRIGEWSLS